MALLNRVPPAFAARLRSDSMAARFLRPIVNALVPEDLETVGVRSGFGQGIRLVIKPREEKYYWTGTHEPEVQLALARELDQGMTVWDVGAHIGFFTVLMGRVVGETGRVHAFEPDAVNRSRLVQAVRLNKLGNVDVHDRALASRSGLVPFYGHHHSTRHTLVRELGDGLAGEVTAATVDELVDELGEPDLMKIDAEGAELEVLRGGLDTLLNLRTVLVVEFSSAQFVDEARRLLPRHTVTQLARRHWLLRPETST